MTPADHLRKAADAAENIVLSEGEERRIHLVALHVIQMCGGDACKDATALLIQLLDE